MLRNKGGLFKRIPLIFLKDCETLKQISDSILFCTEFKVYEVSSEWLVGIVKE